MIDGCTPIQTYFRIVFPVMKPTAISVAILEAMWVWNDYLLPYLVLDIKKYKTIPIAIQYLKGGYGAIDFDSREESDYLPHNYTNNCVVYTGTHDNNTVNGWIPSLSRRDLSFAKKYLNVRKTSDICDSLIRTALGCVADTAIIPMQDYLELGAEARVNTPSTLGGNWEWRMEHDACTEELSKHMLELARIYGR